MSDTTSTTHTERVGQYIGAAILTLGALAGGYSYAAATGIAPAAPWSPIGQHQQQLDQEIKEQLEDVPVAPADPAPASVSPAPDVEAV